MKIYSDILTFRDVVDATRNIEDIRITELRSFTPQWKAKYGYVLLIEGGGDRHKRRRGFGRPGYAATWDDWGVVIARLFAIDPIAIIGCYGDSLDFIAYTKQQAKYRKDAVAPWLTQDVHDPNFRWPNAQSAVA